MPNRYARTGKIIKCAQCQKEVYRAPWHLKKSKSGRKFCSAGCANKFRSGTKASLETRQKMSRTQKIVHVGIKHTEATKKLLSQIQKGKHHSPSTEFKKGKKHTEEHKQYMRELMLQKIKDGIHPNYKGGWENTKHLIILNRTRRRGADGKYSLQEWETLKAQYNWTCPCCKKREPEIILTRDHIVPIVKGGSNNIENIQPLCKSCNSTKHDKTIFYKVDLK